MLRKFAICTICTFLGCLLAAAAPRTVAPPEVSGASGTTSTCGTTTAPSTHQNQVCWNASADSTTATPGTVTLYKLAGQACPANIIMTSFTELEAGLAPSVSGTTPFIDAAVTSGQTNSYVAVAVIGGATSGPSNCWSGTTPSFPPGALTGVAY